MYERANLKVSGMAGFSKQHLHISLTGEAAAPPENSLSRAGCPPHTRETCPRAGAPCPNRALCPALCPSIPARDRRFWGWLGGVEMSAPRCDFCGIVAFCFPGVPTAPGDLSSFAQSSFALGGRALVDALCAGGATSGSFGPCLHAKRISPRYCGIPDFKCAKNASSGQSQIALCICVYVGDWQVRIAAT